MGRPKQNVKPMPVRLPEGVPERIDAVAGKNRRAEFIRDAVERELSRREKRREAFRPSPHAEQSNA
jgi:metal-responsive CopG/Arc/MetJ family transcriptional regulator